MTSEVKWYLFLKMHLLWIKNFEFEGSDLVAGPGTSNSSALESVPGHVPVAAQGLGPGQVNKELIQQLVEEQYHRLQQQQQEVGGQPLL